MPWPGKEFNQTAKTSLIWPVGEPSANRIAIYAPKKFVLVYQSGKRSDIISELFPVWQMCLETLGTSIYFVVTSKSKGFAKESVTLCNTF